MPECPTCGAELHSRVWLVGYKVDRLTYDWLSIDGWRSLHRRGAMTFTEERARKIAQVLANRHYRDDKIHTFICHMDIPTKERIIIKPCKNKLKLPDALPTWMYRLYEKETK